MGEKPCCKESGERAQQPGDKERIDMLSPGDIAVARGGGQSERKDQCSDGKKIDQAEQQAAGGKRGEEQSSQQGLREQQDLALRPAEGALKERENPVDDDPKG